VPAPSACRGTGEYLNQIAKVAMRARLGYGEAAGQFLDNAVIDVPYANSSVLAAAYKLRIPSLSTSPSAPTSPTCIAPPTAPL